MLRKLCLLIIFCLGLSILSACSKDDPDTPSGGDNDPGTVVNPAGTINGHKYVDLGLPSGLLWATCNVGASTPTEFGEYFAWGETDPKTDYTKDNCATWNKNLSDITGNSTYDVARAIWGATWRMPTNKEMQELIDECSWEWKTQNGVTGYEVTGTNGNKIFLPAARYRYGTTLENDGVFGYYWSSTPYNSEESYSLYFWSGNQAMYHTRLERCDGASVRAVLNPNLPTPTGLLIDVEDSGISVTWNEIKIKEVTYNIYRSEDDKEYKLLSKGLTEAKYIDKNPKQSNYYKIRATGCGLESDYSSSVFAISLKSLNGVGNINGHEYVDLGLPSGLKWATCNVGANSPKEYGDYFAWGETKPKSTYTESNSTTYGMNSQISGNPTYDAATANWGGTWRMPTRNELVELIEKCNWRWVNLKDNYILSSYGNGYLVTGANDNGYLVTGANGNQIFLPAAGFRDGSSLYYAGSNGDYWSSTPNDSQNAYELRFGSSFRSVFSYRYYGQSVRAVSE